MTTLRTLAIPVESRRDPRADARARFASRVTAHLNAGTRELPHDISERLRASRERALASRRRPALPHTDEARRAQAERDSSARGLRWWTRIASALPLVALVGGLVAIKVIQDDRRATEVAEVDTALLSGDLPTAAYTDPGFAQFLKTNSEATAR